MAKDGLSRLVNVVEEEPEFPELKIWAVVPGGVIFGTLVSETRFVEYGKELREGRGVSMEEGILRTEMSMHAAEIAEKYPALDTDDHVEACLINVQLFSGGVGMKPKRVRLRIAEVAAWGMGALPDDLVKPTAASREPVP